MTILHKYFTSIYQNRDHYIQVKATHTTYVLFLISLTILIESIVAILSGTTDVIGIVIDTVSVLAFIAIMFVVKSGRLILAGNVFILAGTYKIVEYFSLNYIHQFYLQCLIVLIVTTIIYVKSYQLYIIFALTITTVIYRAFYITSSIDRNYLLSNELIHQTVQVTVGLIVFSIVLYFYDQVIRREIDNGQKLIVLAETDALTSLYNRQKFDQIIASYIQKDEPYCLAIIDIDHFKWINDHHGHAVGDAVLSKFSALLRSYFSNGEYLFRWGGEEFTIISNRSEDFDDFNKKLNDFRELIAETDFRISQILTISIGFTCSSHFPSLDRVLVNADKALYLAKDHGRNRVESFKEVSNDPSS